MNAPASSVAEARAASFMIVARANGGVIGDADSIPWRSSADMEHFRAATMGCAVVMGRRTYDSLPGPLKGRHVVVVTSRPLKGVVGARSVDFAVEAALDVRLPIAFAGGLGIYRAALALPWMKRVILSEILTTVAGDTVLPDFAPEWTVRSWRDLPPRQGEPAVTVCDLRRP